MSQKLIQKWISSLIPLQQSLYATVFFIRASNDSHVAVFFICNGQIQLISLSLTFMI